MTRLALRMGVTAFGGPAAHIAILRHEAVSKRGILSEQQFLDYISLCNIIPGPNSTELIMHVGAHKGGRRGLIAAGLGFIVPAALITLAIAWAYMRWGTSPTGEGLLLGLAPALVVVIALAVIPLARATIRSRWGTAVGMALVALYLTGVHELLLLALGTTIYLIPDIWRWLRSRTMAIAAPLLIWLVAGGSAEPGALRIFLAFLKIGAILYGSGYVLIAFLQRDIVEKHQWLTQQQLVDAVAIGQITPGPLFTTATFVGFVAGGWTGAVAATVGIFLPAFVLVLLTHGWAERIRSSAKLSRVLDGLNLASNALLVGVTLTLLRNLDANLFNALVAVFASVFLLTKRAGPTTVLISAALVGAVWHAL